MTNPVGTAGAVMLEMIRRDGLHRSVVAIFGVHCIHSFPQAKTHVS